MDGGRETISGGLEFLKQVLRRVSQHGVVDHVLQAAKGSKRGDACDQKQGDQPYISIRGSAKLLLQGLDTYHGSCVEHQSNNFNFQEVGLY